MDLSEDQMLLLRSCGHADTPTAFDIWKETAEQLVTKGLFYQIVINNKQHYGATLYGKQMRKLWDCNYDIVTMISYSDDALSVIEIRSVLNTIGDQTNE